MGVRDFFVSLVYGLRFTVWGIEKNKNLLLIYTIKEYGRALLKKTPAYETRLLRLLYPLRKRTQLYTLFRLQL